MTALNIREYILKQAKEYGRTILIATHNMELAGRMDRRVSLVDGQVVELD